MRAIEFKSKISDNRISIPCRVQQELLCEQGKNVRVVIFVKDRDMYDEKVYR